MFKRHYYFAGTLMITCLVMVLSACGPAATPEPILETLVVTEVIQGTPVEVIQLVTPTPEPTGPRTLVICMGNEPRTLFYYGYDQFGADQILEAIYDGPVEGLSYAFQPVILEKLPSLADGDAVLEQVIVNEGDTVVDTNGKVITLDSNNEIPVLLTPAGGTKEDAVVYQGGNFQMDQLSAKFRLFPNLKWSDGTPLTAYDSVYSFKLQASPDVWGDNLATPRTASYEAIDDLTISWTGLPGYRDPTYYINFFIPLPEHIWGQNTPLELLELEESSRKPLGWGPYIIDEWIQGESISLHKNQNYWRADEGLPVFDNLVYRFVGGSGNANIAALLAGECDILDQTSGLEDQSELLLELNDTNQLYASFVPGTVWEHIDFGIQPNEYDDGYQIGIDRPDYFSDVRTRRALIMCMDRQALVDTILFGQSIVIDTYVPPDHPLYNPEVRHYEYDPKAGSALLDEVGWIDEDNDPLTPRIAQGVTNVPDGTLLELRYETTATNLREQVTSILQQTLSECGIGVNIELDASGGIWDRLFNREFELGEFAWLTGVEPPCDLYLSNMVLGPEGSEKWISIMDDLERPINMNGQNLIGFANQEYDLACNAALNSLPGQQVYKSGHLEAQRIFAEQLPVVPLFLRTKIAATRPDFCNFIMDPTAPSEFWNIEEFDYGEGCSD